MTKATKLIIFFALIIFSTTVIWLNVGLAGQVVENELIGESGILAFDKLPYLRGKIKVYRISSHHRNGLNGDGGFVLYEETKGEAVIFHDKGPGCINNIWSLGFPFHVYIDGRGKPILSVPSEKKKDFYGGKFTGFPLPLVSDRHVASGPWKCRAHNIWIPIPYQKECKIVSSHKPFYCIIYQKLPSDRIIESYDKPINPKSLITFWNNCGLDPWEELGYTGKNSSEWFRGKKEIAVGEKVELLNYKRNGAITAIQFDEKHLNNESLKNLWLKCYWDDSPQPAISSPLGIFFTCGVRKTIVRSFPLGMDGKNFYCYFPMPFWRNAKICIENKGRKPITINYNIRIAKKKYPETQCGYFYATYNEEKETKFGRDYLILQAGGRGHYVGTVQTMIGGHYCEGDERIYIDGNRSPAFYGTGSEDYYQCACWPSKKHDTPFAGVSSDPAADSGWVKGNPNSLFYELPQCYFRFHFDAVIPFHRSIWLSMEHGVDNISKSHYTSVAFYYLQSVSDLHLTDELDFGKEVSEKKHNFAGIGEKVFSEYYYEGDFDDYLVKDEGRLFERPFQFNAHINPDNHGVRLRMRIDQGFGRQGAKVFVEDKYIGEWYEPDENKFKRWKETEFEIPQQYTCDKTTISIKLVPSLPGRVWSSYYCWIFSYGDPAPASKKDAIPVELKDSEYVKQELLNELSPPMMEVGYAPSEVQISPTGFVGLPSKASFNVKAGEEVKFQIVVASTIVELEGVHLYQLVPGHYKPKGYHFNDSKNIFFSRGRKDIPLGEQVAWMVTIRIPVDAPQGIYKLRIGVFSGNAFPCFLPIVLKIQRF